MKKIILLLFLWEAGSLQAQTIIGQPHWSPDGNSIVYIVQIDDNYEIYMIDKNGFQNRRLTFTDAFESNTTFSSDGSKILYESNGEGRTQIWTMNIDGSDARNISKSG